MEQSHTYQAGRRPLMSAGTTTPHSPRNILLRAHLNTHCSGCMTTLASPPYHICIVNSRPETADRLCESHPLFKLWCSYLRLLVVTRPPASAECPLWSAWIISWLPDGSCGAPWPLLWCSGYDGPSEERTYLQVRLGSSAWIMVFSFFMSIVCFMCEIE